MLSITRNNESEPSSLSGPEPRLGEAAARRTPSRRRGIPIAFALGLGSGLLTLLTMAIVLAAGYETARRNTAELVADKAALIVRTIDERLQRHIEPVEAQLRFLAQKLADGAAAPQDSAVLAPLLEGSLAAAPQVSVVAFVAPDLRVYRAFRNRPERAVLVSDWAQDDPFVKMVHEGAAAEGLFWGGLFVAEKASRPYMTLGLPVRRGKEPLGVLLASISVAELSAYLGGFGDSDIRNAFILLDRELVLAHASLQNGFPGITDARPLPTLADVPDLVLQRLSAAVPFDASDAPAEVTLRVATVDGVRYLYALRETGGLGGHVWQLGTYLDLAAAAPQLSRLDRLLQAGLALLVVAVLAAIWLGRRLARPIQDLAAAAARVGELNLDEVPKLRGGPFRELRDAARSFNAMIEALRRFESYVPHQLVRRLLRQERPIASEEREVTVMFTDLAGFTTLSEQMSATEVAGILNRHFRIVDSCVDATGGVLDKYIGDAVMAFWGAPDPMDDHAGRAVAAAAAIAAAMQRDNLMQEMEGSPPLKLRIGIHSGRVVVGNIGAPGRVNFTVIGDTVNVAQRLEELAGDLAETDAGVFVLVSEATAQRAGPDFPLRDLGAKPLRGRHDLIGIHVLEVAAGPAVSEVPSP